MRLILLIVFFHPITLLCISDPLVVFLGLIMIFCLLSLHPIEILCDLVFLLSCIMFLEMYKDLNKVSSNMRGP